LPNCFSIAVSAAVTALSFSFSCSLMVAMGHLLWG
jgi:hypothetical protein